MITFKEYLDETSSWKDKKGVDKSKPWSQQVRNSVEKDRKRLERIKNTKGYATYLQALKSINEAYDPDSWENFKEEGKVDGTRLGLGGVATVMTATHKRTGKTAWFFKHPRTEAIRMISSDHELVRRVKYPHKFKESVELDEMARQSKLQPNTTHGPMNSQQLVDLIGKTKANAVFKHPWYKRHVSDLSAVPGNQTAHKVTVDNYGYPTVHSTSSYTYKGHDGRQTRHMIQSALSKDGGKVQQVHLFHNYNNERHDKQYGGSPVWNYIRSLHNDE